MPIVIDYGSDNSNSYLDTDTLATTVDLLKALPFLALNFDGYDNLFQSSPVNPTVVENLLIISASRMDSLPFMGEPFSITQAMAFPRRVGVEAIPHGFAGSQLKELFGQRETPPSVPQMAQAAELVYMLTATSNEDNESNQHARLGVASWSIGNQSVTYDRKSVEYLRPGSVSAVARNMFSSIGALRQGVFTVPSVRG